MTTVFLLYYDVIFKIINIIKFVSILYNTGGIKLNKELYSMLGILIPFIGTTLGSTLVFFMKKNMSPRFQKITVGFAAGVMIAASVWSLILPSVEMAEKQKVIAWMPATIGLILGVVFLIIINKVAGRLENRRNGKKLNMLLFSVTLHNIPERNGCRC